MKLDSNKNIKMQVSKTISTWHTRSKSIANILVFHLNGIFTVTQGCANCGPHPEIVQPAKGCDF